MLTASLQCAFVRNIALPVAMAHGPARAHAAECGDCAEAAEGGALSGVELAVHADLDGAAKNVFNCWQIIERLREKLASVASSGRQMAVSFKRRASKPTR